MRTESNYIRTYTGKKAWPLELHPEDVDIIDIAHALSNQCRFTGHTKDFYSVAQHCLEVSFRCSAHESTITDPCALLDLSLAGLLHDADEAYLVDLATPIKHGPGMELFKELGKEIEKVIFDKFHLPIELAPMVKPIDRQLYELERNQFMPSGSGVVFTTPMLPREAERKFLERFYQLTCEGIGDNDFGTSRYSSK